jgi:hexosaminidase
MERSIIPAPASVTATDGVEFEVTDATRIVAPTGSEAARIGGYLADLLRRSTGFPVEIGPTAGIVPGDTISLAVDADAADLGDEGYELKVDAEAVTLRAHRPAGLFHGVQSLRQLLPSRVESGEKQDGPWHIPGGTVVDKPRFAWRGAGLDVARHFFTVDEIKKYVDEIALYKINVLHLHLTDDQGWRIEIKKWPELTKVGASTAVGGGKGGFYTQEQYAEIVQYAAERFVTIVPEIDMPGHTNAALASYAELNCDGKARPTYTGIDVGFSSLCVDKPVTYEFLDDVLGELAVLTPSPYLHIGGDEVKTLPAAEYATFIERVQQIVLKHGKQVLGWQEIAAAKLVPGAVTQYWDINASPAPVAAAVKGGAKVILSPASKAYLDMKYHENSKLGLQWAGFVEVRDAYDWEPATLLDGIGEDALLGVEAPIWSETLEDLDAVEFMAFPRLPAIAEIGWSPVAAREWESFGSRLAGHGPRWTAMGVNFYRSEQISWPE